MTTPATPSPGYRNYMVATLLVVLAFNVADRTAIGLLLQDIKVDLALSDTQLGFVTGIAFALFYSLMGIPIARWADTGNRVRIISITAMCWSVAVALCGAAQNFIQLILIRIAVAVGEAGCLPPAHSLIADHFDREERAKATSLYLLGGPVGIGIGYIAAGWISHLYGWRVAFVALGLPGLLVGLVTWLTLREPRSEARMSRAADAEPLSVEPETETPISFLSAMRTLWSIKSYREIVIAFSVASFFCYGVGLWQPTFILRSFDVDIATVGTWFALIYGVTGVVGIYIGGALTARFAARDERLQLRAIAALIASFGVISTITYLSTGLSVTLITMTLSSCGLNMIMAPMFSLIQTLVEPRLRAVAIAVIYLFSNLLGMGLGPLVAGALSDGLAPWAGDESIRYALLMLCPGFFWGGWHAWRASRFVEADLKLSNSPLDIAGKAAHV